MTDEQFQMLVEVHTDVKAIKDHAKSTRRMARRAHRRLDIIERAGVYRSGALAVGWAVLVCIGSVIGAATGFLAPKAWDAWVAYRTVVPPGAAPRIAGSP